jgi:hypothetical protein
MHSAAPRRTASAATDTLFGGGCEAGKLRRSAINRSAPASFPARRNRVSGWPILRPTTRISYLDIPPRGADFHQYEAQRLQINEAMQNISGLASFNLDEALTCGWTLPCKNYQPDLLHFTRDG